VKAKKTLAILMLMTLLFAVAPCAIAVQPQTPNDVYDCDHGWGGEFNADFWHSWLGMWLLKQMHNVKWLC